MSENHLRESRLFFPRRLARAARFSHGFSLLELLAVAAIGTIMVAVALPIINNTMTNMHLSSAATTIAGVIQSTRYQAIAAGCPYEVVITAATNSYQIETEQIQTSSSAPPQCATTYTYVCQPGPAYSSTPCVAPPAFAGSDVTVSFSPTAATQTVVLNPSGIVSTTSSSNPSPASISIICSTSKGIQTKTVNVHGLGNVSIQ
jgi:prepilin-type N-terminal cleavage/methylation domain-containing protein